ncbi:MULTISPECIES: YebW family protein [unclassified Serratia (in: enterobacteria)]|uniref:YebW family protein n=1 Tax=unclassified Serratia (in: enterobacteria) TaxID=2647522 RepID=UPI00307606BD
MYALMMFVCYLDGGCADIVVDVLRDEQQCLLVMKEQRLRHAGCYPIEDVIDGLWLPADQ